MHKKKKRKEYVGKRIGSVGRRLWFIRKGNRPVSVFPSQRGAQYELDALQRESAGSSESYTLYCVDVDDLEDHPAELTLAENEGII